MPVLIACKLTMNPDLRELGVSGRQFTRIMKEVHFETGMHWFEHFLWRHWEAGAAAKYGYQSRTAQYLRAKVKAAQRGKAIAGGRIPMLYSGQMRSDLKRFALVRAFPSRVSVTMRGPRYVGMRPYKSGHPNMGAEVTATTPDERQELAKFMLARMATKIQQLNLPVTVTIE